MPEDMASQGWLLVKTSGTCTRFTFEKRDPARIRYCIDYQDQEKPDYLALLEDAGWKLEHKGSGWYIWSRAYEDEKPELFTDKDSLIRRNNTILGSMATVLMLQVPVYIALSDNINQSRFGLLISLGWAVIIGVLAGLVVGMAFGSRKFQRRKSITK